MNRILLPLLFLLASSLSLRAQTVWTIDQSHSTVLFTVTHMMISEVDGWFADFNGNMTSEGSEFEQSKIEVTINTTSVSTANEKRDGHLRSADFFDVEHFPTATFVSSAIKKTGEKTYDLEGNLTMKGTTQSVVLKVTKTGQITDSWGNDRIGFRGTTTIDRYAWGLNWNKGLEAGGLLVSKNVDLTFNMQFVSKKK
jgi:polyisoprenoid-binding protein YceI